MAKFKFDIGCIFSQPVVKISSNLLPHTFLGDRRMAMDVSSKVSEIIDRLGELSAIAQKLSRPITSAQKLRMSENQTVYLMADINGCDGDVVIGLLKIGTKNLYLFDSTGQTKKIDKARCILDFYIHDSRQRMGIGKILFDIMLKEESWSPVKCSVDRPSEKLIQFLKKYYGLEKIIPQANKFVLYEGFFDEDEDANRLKVMLPIHNRSSIKENNCTIQIPHNQFNKQQKFYHSSMFPPISPKQLHQCSLSQPRIEAARNQQPLQSSPVPAPEPELCTTCPNCQTTIYLVRGHDTSSEPAQGYTSIQHDTTGSTAAN